MNKKLNRALARTEQALKELEAEMALHGQGKGSVSSPEQLGAFRDQLLAMKRELEAGKVTGQFLGMGRAITDSWPWDTVLGETLLGAEQSYREAG